MSDWLFGVRVPALSIADIRNLTSTIRHSLGIPPDKAFPVLEFLEFALPEVFPEFSWIVVESLPHGDEACAFPDGCTENPDGPFIKLTEEVYEAAYRGEGRSRLTIGHECGHIFLHRKVAVHHRGPRGAELKPYENSEWQATTFAAEILMPPDSFLAYQSLAAYCKSMEVSRQAALVQGEKLQRRGELRNVRWLN